MFDISGLIEKVNTRVNNKTMYYENNLEEIVAKKCVYCEEIKYINDFY